MRKGILAFVFVFLCSFMSFGQFNDSGTGNLQTPTAEFGKDGTFMITNLFMNKHSLAATGWDNHTFGYGINLSLFERLEIGYMCVLFDGRIHGTVRPDMRNQDRHFSIKLGVLKEGDFWEYMPSVAIGVSDPLSGSYGGYFNEDFREDINGYFNRAYIILSKHFSTNVGPISTHLGYQVNGRKDYRINAPCIAVSWYPKWLQMDMMASRFIAEFDSRTFNIGIITSIWEDRFEAMIDLQALKWLSFGVRYKIVINS